MANNVLPSLKPEIDPDGLAREAPIIAYTEKIIEAEKVQLRKYHLNEEKAEWIIYVTDVGQQEHFEMFFLTAKKAGWLPLNDNAYPKVTHVGFGLVMGNDGKRFRTRSSEVVRLVDLLDEAKNRSKQKLIERGKAEEWTEEELDQTAEAAGYGAIKFADLVNNRLSNYTFSFDHMLNDQMGMASALDTFCGQAYGAKRYDML